MDWCPSVNTWRRPRRRRTRGLCPGSWENGWDGTRSSSRLLTGSPWKMLQSETCWRREKINSNLQNCPVAAGLNRVCTYFAFLRISSSVSLALAMKVSWKRKYWDPLSNWSSLSPLASGVSLSNNHQDFSFPLPSPPWPWEPRCWAPQCTEWLVSATPATHHQFLTLHRLISLSLWIRVSW